MIVFFVYLVILALGLISVFMRNKSLLLQGKSFLKFTLLFFVIVVLTFAVKGTFKENLVTFIILLTTLIIAIIIRRRWIIFRYNTETISKIIEDSLSKILMPFQKTEQGYIVKSGTVTETILHINIFFLFFLKCAIFSFEGELRTKKVEVWQNLLKKSFDGIFPRLVIKLK
jgi:hypothetical protein